MTETEPPPHLQLPFVVPFMERLEILHSVIRQDRIDELGAQAGGPFHLGPAIVVSSIIVFQR